MEQAHPLSSASTKQNEVFHQERPDQSRVLGELLSLLDWLVPTSSEVKSSSEHLYLLFPNSPVKWMMLWKMGTDPSLSREFSVSRVVSTWKETSGVEKKFSLPWKSTHVGMLPWLAGQVLNRVCSSVVHRLCSATSLILNADTVVPALTYCVKD